MAADDAARVLRRSLWPLSFVYAGVAALRNGLFDRGIKRVHRIGLPVISVGNLTVGGTGKTPMVSWLVERAQAEGLRPAILARGYGRAPGAELNDEGLLLRQRHPDVPQVQDPDRVAGAQALERRGDVDLVILDDGFQHRRLHRDRDLVLVDARRPLADHRVLPAGDLRELPAGLHRADLVVMTRAEGLDAPALDQRRAGLRRIARRDDLPVLAAEHAPHGVESRPGTGALAEPGSLRGRRVFLVSSIARPASFEATVERLGAEVVEHRAYRDHHRHDHAALRELARRATELGAELLTTAKDAVKFPDAEDCPHLVLHIGLRFLGAEPDSKQLGLDRAARVAGEPS